MMKVKRVSPAWQKAWKVEKFHSVVLNTKIGSVELFVTCLNHDSESKIKLIKYYLESIRSCFVSQHENKLISNCEQFFIAMDL